MSTNILSERSSNIPISPEKKDAKDSKKEAPAPAPKSLEYHRQMLESRLKEDNSSQTYVSPSDTIQSPATQKLAAFRTKHIKAAKPRSLFAKTTAKNAGDLASTSTSTTSSQESQKDME